MTTATLPPHVGIIYVHDSTVTAKLRGLTGHAERSATLSRSGSRCVGSDDKGDLVFQLAFKTPLGTEAMEKLDVVCAKIEGLLYVAPYGTEYRLLSLPFTAGKKKDKTFEICRKGIRERAGAVA